MHNNVKIKDLSERTKTKDMIQMRDQQYIVGQLAASIAHEIRNPLTVIKGFMQLGMEEKPSKNFDVVMLEITKIELIINDLLHLAKPQISNFEEMDIQKILNDSFKLFPADSSPCNIGLDEDIRLTPPTIKDDVTKLKQTGRMNK